MDEDYHWSGDRYWIDALAAYQRRRNRGIRFLTIDLDALEKVAFDGDGPAYALMKAICSVESHEAEDGYRGAPRVLFASLLRMAELSATTGRITGDRQASANESDVV